MHSMRQRGCDIVASAVSAFLVMALLTAATTIVRDVVLRPRPVVHDVRISGTSPLYLVRTPTLLSRSLPDAALYFYHPANAAPHTLELPANIEVLDLVDRAGDSEDDRKRKAWQRQRVPTGFDLGVRSTNRIILYLSGSIDFAALWDWNTKAVYISFVARFTAPSAPANDVVSLDAVMRSVTVPASVARLADRRRREREAKRLADAATTNNGGGGGGAASSGAAVAAVEPLLTEAERQQLTAFEATLRNKEHDHPSLYIDHIDRVLYLNESFKYFVDAFDNVSLPGRAVEVVLRYQVMSYSGWAPVREEVLGHQVKVQMPTTAIPFDTQRR